MTQLLTDAYRYNEGGSPAWELVTLPYASGTGTRSNSSTFAQQGVKSFKIVSTSSDGLIIGTSGQDIVPCTEGSIITYSGYVRGSNAIDYGAGVVFYDDSDSPIDGEGFFDGTVNTSAFELSEGSIEVPYGVAGFQFFMSFECLNGQTFYWDNISLDLLTISPAIKTAGFFNLMPPVLIEGTLPS